MREIEQGVGIAERGVRQALAGLDAQTQRRQAFRVPAGHPQEAGHLSLDDGRHLQGAGLAAEQVDLLLGKVIVRIVISDRCGGTTTCPWSSGGSVGRT